MTVNEVKGACFRKKENVLSSHSINLYLPVFGLKTDFLIASHSQLKNSFRGPWNAIKLLKYKIHDKPACGMLYNSDFLEVK